MMKDKDESNHKFIQAVIFRLRNEEFGVYINSVKEIVRLVEITHIPDAPGFLEGVINIRGQVIPVINLAKQFGFPPLDEYPKTARIIVIEMGVKLIGMIVDEVPQVLSILEENIQESPELFKTTIKTDYISGIAKLDERLIVMLNLANVLEPRELAELNKMSEGEHSG
jgi:purine-binding chemotaxis protein CheW